MGVLRLLTHFFGTPRKLFKEVVDPRHQSFITYPADCLFFTGILMHLCRLGARQLVSSNLRDGSPEIANLFRLMFGVGQAPVGDTINNLY